jgi:hypothetical protein
MNDPDAMPEPEADPLRHLVRSALNDPASSPDVLAGVQRKLRQRSQGKFYRDAWSTARHPPVHTYLVTSLLMLAIVAAAYAVLHPLSSQATTTPMTPAPVHVLPSPKLVPSG